MQFAKEELEDSVKKCITIADVGRCYGINTNGGRNFQALVNALRKWKIDTSHFLGKASRKGKRPPTFLSKEDAIKRFTKNGKTHIGTLKILLRRYDLIPYQCECGNRGIWRDKPMNLQIDHINGNKKDQRLENLRWICANCHTQTETFAGRNKNAGVV